MKDEDEIKRFLREQRNQWRKESKFKTRQRTEEEVAEDDEEPEDGEEEAEEEGEGEESSEQEQEESSVSEDEEFVSAAKTTKRQKINETKTNSKIQSRAQPTQREEIVKKSK